MERVTVLITIVAIFFSVVIAYVATRRITQVNSDLKRTNVELRQERNRLEKALAEIKTLRGIIRVCSNCRQIRDDEGAWKALEIYLGEHSDAVVSHSLCPKCLTKLYPELADEVNARMVANEAGGN